MGLLAGRFCLAFALVAGALRALSRCLAVARKMAWFAAVEAEAVVALFVALWVGDWLGGRALPFALVVAIAIAPCAGRILALAGLVWWRVTLLVCCHVIFDRFR